MNFIRQAATRTTGSTTNAFKRQQVFSVGQKRNMGVKKNAAFEEWNYKRENCYDTFEITRKNAFSLFWWAFGVPYALLVFIRASEINHDMSGKNWKNPDRTMVKYW